MLVCNLRAGLTRSCGCLARETTIARHTKHGQTPDGTRPPPTYMTWIDMVQRCTNPNDAAWRDYGGRGIVVCPRWRASYADFFADMGERPAGMSIDRIDVNGDYEPGNCRWADDRTQARNKRNNRRMTLDGETMLLCEWVERLGISRAVIAQRLHRGWSDERALTQPVLPPGHNRRATMRASVSGSRSRP